MGNLNKLIKENMNSVSIALFFVFGLSGSALCFINSLGRYDGLLLCMACSIAFFGFGMFATNLTRCFRTKQDYVIMAIALFVSFITVYRISKQYEVYSLRQTIFALPAISLIIFFVLRELLKLVLELFKDRETLIFWIVASVVLTLTVSVFYTKSDFFYRQTDRFLSMDSGLCFNAFRTIDSVYGNTVDVKHPILWVLYYPTYAISYYLSKIASLNIDLTSMVIYQIINIQFVVLSTILLSRIANNKYVKYIYLVTAPVISLLLFIEKFQMILFVLLLMLYYLKKNSISKAILLGAISAALMPTTSVLVLGILFYKDLKFNTRFLIIIKSAVVSILMIICMGFGDGIFYFVEGSQNHLAGSTLYFIPSFFNLIFAYTHFFKNMLFQDPIVFREPFLEGQITVGKPILWWEESLNNYVSIIGIALITLTIISIIKYRKKKLTRLNSFWLLFSAILIIGIKWAWYESPLFSWYFSWCLILTISPMLESIAEILPKKDYLYIPLIIVIFTWNIIQIAQAIYMIFTIM